MVGLIHKILLGMVESAAGPEAVAEIRRLAEIRADKAFRMDEAYPDPEWRRLFETTCKVLDVSADEAERQLAAYFLKDAEKRWPEWFRMSRNSREFLERQPAIHSGFAAGVRQPKARAGIADKFRIEKSENEIVTYYRSDNKLCGLYKNLADEVIRRYGDSALIEERRCMKDGADECEIHVVWTRNGAD